jgi:CheY-like chemotaxis protein
MTALVVDDSLDSRLILEKMLASFGLRVETLPSGEEALQRLQQTEAETVALIVIDWLMPELDGIETSRRIRQELHLSLPIIMVTAFGRETQAHEAAAVGVNRFLSKPVYPSTLFNALLEALGRCSGSCTPSPDRITTRASLYRSHLRGLRVLVAEDNPTNQQIAQAIFENAGIAVEIAPDGEAAVAAATRSRFDAIFMDIQMPRMGGYEATRRLRAVPATAAVPIIAMTAHAMKGDEEKCLAAGMDGYVAKPISQERLFTTLWRLVGDHGEKRASDPVQAQGEQPVTSFSARSAAASDLPDHLPGIDLAMAMGISQIEPAAFRAILLGFRQNNLTSSTRLLDAMRAGQREPLRHMAHSLKGSGAGIGASALQAAAAELEAACTAAEEDWSPTALSPLVERVTRSLEEVLASIAGTEQKAAADHNPPAQKDESVSSDGELALQGLVLFLEQADPEKIQAGLERVGRHLRQHPLFPRLQSQIAAYDYRDALATVNRMRSANHAAIPEIAP